MFQLGVSETTDFFLSMVAAMPPAYEMLVRVSAYKSSFGGVV